VSNGANVILGSFNISVLSVCDRSVVFLSREFVASGPVCRVGVTDCMIDPICDRGQNPSV
jgi:hypothetical protein